MTAALLGRKKGMTRYYTEDGVNIPVTVIEAGPCAITQIKTTETDGYSAVQIGYEDIKPRRSTIPVIGHDAKAGVTPKRVHRELRLGGDKDLEAYEPGQNLDVSVFEGIKFVDVCGTSKGKGFQGPMKRHNFRGKEASHGTQRVHRGSGSIGGHSTNLGKGSKIKRGKRMAGRMGNHRVTERSLDLVAVDPERNLLLVKGAVPGPNNGLVLIREAVRLNKSKATKAK